MDIGTGVVFTARVDYRSGHYIGFAWVAPEVAEKFYDRQGFEIPSDAEWAAVCQPPPANAPTASTGDPLKDAASEAPIPSDVDALKKLGFGKLKQIAISLGIELKAKNESIANLAEQIAAKNGVLPAQSSNPEPASAPPPPPPSI